jgi:heparanase 1
VLRVAVVSCLVGVVSALIAAHRGSPPAQPTPPRVALSIETGRAAAEVEDRFLSVAIDTAEVVGGDFWAPPGQGKGPLKTHPVARYDFARPRLRELARALAPAYLRIGGTAADWTVYRMDDGASASPASLPEGARWTLTRQRWDEVSAFARDVGFHIMFTLNAGESARDADGAWDPTNARALVAYAQEHGDPVDVWELGNELNAFPVLHWTWLSADRYAGDVGRARAMLRGLGSPARLAGLATAYWPVMGEWRSFTDDVLREAGSQLDIVTWHYYPQQSQRCPLATRRARPGVLPTAADLDDVEKWADRVESSTHLHAPAAAVWLGETASAQCGGEPDLSNGFADALWWLDELGRVARRGQRVVVRQTLSGSDYGLIDDETLRPNPSYWASWLWHQFMGRRVLAVTTSPAAPAVRTYAHCLAGDGAARTAGVALLVANLDPTRTVDVELPGMLGTPSQIHRLTADGLASRTMLFDGIPLELDSDGRMPALPASDLASVTATGMHQLPMPPLSAAFVLYPAAAATACDGSGVALGPGARR